MIELKGVGRTFRPGPGAARGAPIVEALADVSLQIPRGQTWAVVGPNGAGKSTFFALLLGFLHPTTGTISVAGEDPRTYVRRHGASYLPESFRLPAEWTVRSALRALAGLEGLSPSAAGQRVEAQLARFGLESHGAKAIGTLSRGLLQRTGLAQALLVERELVVLDEPTEGLDPLWRIRFRTLVEELRADTRTILIASHDLAEVERLADRVLLLEGGRVREIMEVGNRGDATTYRLELASDAPSLGDVFPGAIPVDGGRPGARAFVVTAADAAELSRRLAALIDTGGVIASVAPAGEALEERVRRALRGPA